MPSTCFNRLGSVAIFDTYKNSMNQIHSRIGVNQQKMSGNSYELFSQMGRDGVIKQSMDLSQDYIFADTYIKNAQAVKMKTEAMMFSTKNIIEICQRMKEHITINFNKTIGSLDTLKIYADESLNYINSILNINVAGDYIFSGSKINVLPVNDIFTPNFSLNKNNEIDFEQGDATINYFQGDFIKKKIHIGSSMELEFGFCAGEQAIADVIGGMHLVKKSYSCGDKFMTRALNMIRDGVEELAQLEHKVIRDNTLALRSIEYNEEVKKFTLQQYDQIESSNNVDLTSLLLENANLNNILNASMQSYSNYSKLNILNYLK